jgi:hypothetical protein
MARKPAQDPETAVQHALPPLDPGITPEPLQSASEIGQLHSPASVPATHLAPNKRFKTFHFVSLVAQYKAKTRRTNLIDRPGPCGTKAILVNPQAARFRATEQTNELY